MNSGALVFLAVLATVAVSICSAGDCSSKFKQDDKHANASQGCVTKLDINPEDMPKSEEEFQKKFDDKCFAKCFLTEMGFIKDFKFDRDVIKADIKEHVLDEDLRKKVENYTMSCLDESDAELKKSDDGKITAANECKVCARFLYCTVKHEEKLEC